MHSVVVFGDIRTHGFMRDPADKRRIPTMYGGALMMAAAVDQALEELAVYPTQKRKPRCFSFVRKGTGQLGFEFCDWHLKVTRLDPNDEEEQLRLEFLSRQNRLENEVTLEKPPNPKRFQFLDSSLIEALARFDDAKNTGCFDPPEKRDRWCPDIVVFDDLGGDLRRVRFRAHPSIAVLRPSSNNKKNFDEALRCIMQRLLAAGAQVRKQPDQVPLEPVVICCVGGALPDIAPNLGKEGTFWDCLYHERELRNRTIILLDAADLRKHEHLAISSGLSWERTAQDTIAELCRSARMNMLLEFSQVIIRFGVTGSLHITRQGEKTWAYQLYFDPANDDRMWTEAETFGEVLGYAAVTAASLVQRLTRACEFRSERPVMHDLSDVMGETIPVAIARCQELVKKGYRSPPDDETDLEKFPDDLFLRGSSSSIASVPVSPLRSRFWSIASHVSQGRTGTVARNIVRFGTRLALNQAVPTHKEFSENWADRFSKAIWEPGYIETDWDDDAEDVVGESFEEVTAALVQLPTAQREAYRKLAKAERLFSKVEQYVAHAFSEARKLAKKHKLDRLEEYEKGLFGVVDDLIEALSRTFSQDLRLPSRLDPRFNPVNAPVVKFGNEFTLVDRREIEGIRAIQKLIKAHLDNINAERDPTKHKPLSIAVFGPPGSGKSTAVKQIVKLFENHPTKTYLMEDAFNLAQFTKSENLDLAFDEIVNAGAEHKVPIAFFDEFDARFNDEEWGWLKFFLSPMEDGRYRGKPVHTAIFVFAGGTSPTYSHFCLENRATTDPQVQAFGRAKGPDFVSRLRGFLNVVGINPADSDDELYLIRRAIVIRTTLARIQGLKETEEARIDTDMLRAILFVPSYVNGARSIRTLLEICSRSENKRVTNSALPLIHQLNMLTDGKAFLDLLANVSADSMEAAESGK